MTSANVTEYIIFDKNGKEVGKHHFHHYCKPKWEKLLAFQPCEDFTILDTWLDEEEEYFEGKEINLKEFLTKLKVI
jgi:hypothetical protein